MEKTNYTENVYNNLMPNFSTYCIYKKKVGQILSTLDSS